MPIDHFPKKSRPILYSFRRWLMGDQVAVLVLGAGIIGRGMSYLPWAIGGPPERGTHPAEAFFPITLWGMIWVAVGVVCIAASIVSSRWLQALAVGGGVGLNFMWAWSFMLATFTGAMPRGWVSSIGYGSVAVLVLWAVWRGSRLELEEEVASGLRDTYGKRR